MSKRAYWILFVLTMALYLVMVSWSLPLISAEAGGLIPFDMRPGGYSFEEARAFLVALTPDGRSFYLNTQLRFDMAYPAMLAVVLAVGGLAMTRQRARIVGIVIAVAAIGGAGSDYFENWAITRMLHTQVVDLQPATVDLASTATLAKSGLTTLAMGLVFALIIIAAVKRFQNRRRNA